MFDLRQLEQLVVIAEQGTLSAAARELHLSQPALTRSMQRLENEFGIELFTHEKNRVTLNDAGLLAVEQARGVLGAAEGMKGRMHDYARAQKTVAVGSCAPGPMWLIATELIRHLTDKTVSTEMKAPDVLLDGLLREEYQVIVLDTPVKQDSIVCREYLTERLAVSLPPAHPLAKKKGILLSDLKGQTMLLYSDLGVWNKLRDDKMQDIRFIVQSERKAFADLVSASVLPNFTTNLSHLFGETPPLDRVEVPILDGESTMTFYLCVLKKNRKLLDHITIPQPEVSHV